MTRQPASTKKRDRNDGDSLAQASDASFDSSEATSSAWQNKANAYTGASTAPRQADPTHGPGMKREKRLLCIFIEPAPYMVALANELERQWQGRFEATFLEPSLTQEWEVTTEGNEKAVPKPQRRQTITSVVAKVLRTRPSHILAAGWSDRRVIAATLTARVLGSRISSQSDTWISSNSALRRAIKLSLFKAIDTFVPSGTPQSLHLLELRVPRSKIHIGCMASDTTAISRSVANITERHRREYRTQEFGTKCEFHFLYFGRLSPEKEIGNLMRGFLASKNQHRSGLTVIGSGPCKEDLTALSAPHKNIILRDRMNGPELWNIISLADASILNSTKEPWGLTLIESLACGTPIIASTHCGAAKDLLRSGYNGVLINPNSPAGVAAAIDRYIETTESKGSLRANASASARAWTTQAWARNTLRAIQNI